MDIEISLTQQIDEIQRRLRECNFECNRLKELVVKSLPELLRGKEDSAAELRSKSAQITALQQQLDDLRKQRSITTKDSPISKPETVVQIVPPVVEPVSETVVPVLETVTPVVETMAPVLETVAPVTPVTAPATENRSKTQPVAPAKSKEGLEDFIGGNVLNKIGIGILIIGIGIFVKYAIDKDWIGPVGRVMVGLLSGGILLGVAHWLRNSYKAFSSVLLGGGIVVLYFSVAIAFHEYGLLSQTAAFALMCGITGATVFFSIAYNRQEIAILALLGSFVTPFLVSNGDGNWVVLFTYILIVNVGMLVLAWFREWKLVRIIGYVLTLLLFGGWVLREYSMHEGIVPIGSLVFGTLFFLTFFMTNLAYRVRKQQVADTFTYISLISNTVFYYACSMLVIQKVGGGMYMGLFTAAMAVFHFSFILPLRKLLKVDDHIQTMLIGLVLSFVTLAIPIQLDGDYITLFWALEAILLLYMAQRTRIGLLNIGSVLVSILAVIVLGYHWGTHYLVSHALDHPFLFNGAYLTSLLTAASMVGLYFLHKRDGVVNVYSPTLSKVYQMLSLPLFYLGFIFELVDWLRFSDGAMVIGVSAFTALYLSGMMVWALLSGHRAFGNVVTVFGLLAIVIWSLLQGSLMPEMLRDYMAGVPYSETFPWHFLAFFGVLLLLGLSYYHAQKQVNLHGDMGKVLVWVSSVLVLIVLSMELDHVLGLMGINSSISHKVGYPILWGLSGFAMIAVGMREKLLALRIGGLALFLLILLKLFLFDIREVSEGGKIAAFISLGVLLLVISFMYQRLRKLLISQDEATTNEEPK